MGMVTRGADSAKAEHEPITIMSANKDYTGFIEYAKSVYPEINIEIMPYFLRISTSQDSVDSVQHPYAYIS